VLAATIEAVMAKDLLRAKVMDPDLPFQSMTPRRALALLKEVRIQHLAAGTQQIKPVSRHNALQAKVMRALSVDTSTGSKAPEQDVQVTRREKKYSPRPYLPRMTRKLRQSQPCWLNRRPSRCA
jgi:hypothetical protein